MVKRAFTLVELLIVIAIIAVMVAILLPALARARDAATATACLSNLRQISNVLHMYANEYAGLCPLKARSSDAWTQTLLYARSSRTVLDDFSAYTFLRCPSADATDKDLALARLGSNSGIEITDDQSFPGSIYRYTNSYSINEGTFHWVIGPPDVPTPTKLSSIRPAAKYVYAYDGRASTRIDNGNPYPLPGAPDMSLGRKNNIQSQINTRQMFRHGRPKQGWTGSKLNALYFDGHAEGNLEFLRPAQLDFRRPWTMTVGVAP
jgi:prepilin-type N-terminal cleavage/methylation domain-containing protein/prepilin-type processing-associated H-X9-DG protein